MLGVDVDRHAPAVVHDLHRLITAQGDFDAPGKARKRFVDAVVHDFLDEVIRASGVGVHAGALAHRLESREDLDGFCGVL